MRSKWFWVSTALLITACADGDVTTEEANHTSHTGPISWAPVVQLDATYTGSITSQQFDVWALDLRAGDQLTLVNEVQSGDLKPDLKLFKGNTAMSSASFDVESGKLTKSYVIEDSGRYYVGVRAYQGTGTGAYGLDVSCTGGPCAGDPITQPLLSPGEANRCIRAARECAFDGMGVYNGAVGPSRANQLFYGCLAEVKINNDTQACTAACEGEDATRLCSNVVSIIPFFADQSDACLSELNTCLSDCYVYDGESGWDDELLNRGENMCLFDGLNGSCTGYAEDHEYCGGELQADARETCIEQCEASWGAWSDDLYGGCEEAC